MRGKTGIDAPAMTGDPLLERAVLLSGALGKIVFSVASGAG